MALLLNARSVARGDNTSEAGSEEKVVVAALTIASTL